MKRLFGYPLSEELFSGPLSFNKVTMTEIKLGISNAIAKRENRLDPEGTIKKFLISNFL